MGTAKAGIAVKLKDTDSNGKGRQIRSTGYEALTGKSSRYARVTLPQSNLLVTRCLIKMSDSS
jgi:hypothetical protein